MTPMATGAVRERVHFGRPVTPLLATTLLPAIERAYRAASEAQGGGPGAIEIRVVDGYVYTAWSPLAIAPPAAPPPALPDLVAEWERERLPEARRLLDQMRGLLRADVPDRRAAGEFEVLCRAFDRLLFLHYETGQVARGAFDAFAGMLRARGDPAPELTVATLLSPCPSALRDVEAWLATLGDADPRASPRWAEVRERPSRIDFDAPTWGEEPDLARALAGVASAASLAEGTRRAEERRQAAEAETLARFPAEARETLLMIVDALRRTRGVQQTLNFLVGEIAIGVVRGAALRAGARIGLGEDVVWLEREELAASLAGEPVPRGPVASRQAAHARALRTTPPDVVGQPDPAMTSDPRIASMLGVRGVAAGLAGIGASPGVAEGPVRVLRSEEDLAGVVDGDVLVVVVLEPTWTPAMQRAAGIVAELGGILSHAAVVAREMGKPAVVGLADATRRLRSGGRIKVDGTSGEVTVLEKGLST